MKKTKSTDVRIRHKATGLWLEVENLGRPVAENDVYGHDKYSASVFRDKESAGEVAKRLKLSRAAYEIV